VTLEQLDSIHAQMTENESLLICAKSYAPGCENHFSSITVKKIPQMILGKCEFGKKNYDLNIVKTTMEEAEDSNEAIDEQ
jgi:adenine-specific DNA-methyltransferase